MKRQKESIIDEVILMLPNFIKYKDNAILLLNNAQLETIKANIMSGIVNNTIDYSKDRNNKSEVRTYSRSCVMNHIKKAKELNGGHIYQANVGGAVSTPISKTIRVQAKLAPKGVNPDLLPEDLREYVKSLV